MELCNSSIKLSTEICEFIESGAMEESITDYLSWQIKKWNSFRTYFLNINKFTRPQENRITGADIEIAFIDSKNRWSIHLVIQAKKIVEEYNSYCKIINHANGSQIRKLINYSISNGKLPFYLFYSNLDKKIKNMCRYYCNYINFYNPCNCLVLKSALIVKKILNKECNKQRSSLDKYKLINDGNPFSCLFCCPITHGENPSSIEHLFEYFYKYYRDLIVEIGEKNILKKEIPDYINRIINGELERELEKVTIEEKNIDSILDILRKYNLILVDEKEEKKNWIIKRILVVDLIKDEKKDEK